VAPTHPGLIDLEFSGDKDGVDTDGSSCAQNEDESHSQTPTQLFAACNMENWEELAHNLP